MWSHLCHAASPPASATWRAMRFTSTLRRVGDGASTARVAAGAADMVSGDLPTPQTCHTGLPDGCRGSDICMDNLFTTPDILLEMQKMNHGGAGIWRPQVPPVLEVVRLRKPSIGRFQRGDCTAYVSDDGLNAHLWHDCSTNVADDNDSLSAGCSKLREEELHDHAPRTLPTLGEGPDVDRTRQGQSSGR